MRKKRVEIVEINLPDEAKVGDVINAKVLCRCNDYSCWECTLCLINEEKNPGNIVVIIGNKKHIVEPGYTICISAGTHKKNDLFGAVWKIIFCKVGEYRLKFCVSC